MVIASTTLSSWLCGNKTVELCNWPSLSSWKFSEVQFCYLQILSNNKVILAKKKTPKFFIPLDVQSSSDAVKHLSASSSISSELLLS